MRLGRLLPATLVATLVALSLALPADAAKVLHRGNAAEP